MEAKRMRLNENLPARNQQSSQQNSSNKLDLQIWQNIQLSKCIDDNYINRLLESTRAIINITNVAESTPDRYGHRHLENEAISSAITCFGLSSKKSLGIYDDLSDDSNISNEIVCSPSTSGSSRNISSLHPLEDTSVMEDAINSAITSYGLHRKNN